MDEFVGTDIIDKVKWTDVKKVRVAESRSIDDVALRNLFEATKKLSLNAYRIVYRYLFSTGIRCCDQYSHTEDTSWKNRTPDA